jgi:leucyl/phenylalanyl-tRNA--protein transferase
MTILQFPPLETASPEGILALGGDFEVGSLLLAYRNGIFPWPTEDFPLLWFAPPERAILEFKDLRVPRRFKQELKKLNFRFAVDRNFSKVIRACAVGNTRKSHGTWITDDLIRGYLRFHEAGYAHSFECYNEQEELVGGLYGVSLGNMFAGESMFYLESGASKAALLFAVGYLKEKGATWMDVQTMSPLLSILGAKGISRDEFMKKLKKALRQDPILLSSRRGSGE